MIRYIFIITLFLSNISFSKANNWFISSGEYSSSKFSNLNQINKDNIDKLNTAWVYKNGFTNDRSKSFSNNQATPIFTGRSLIVTSLDNYIISLDPESGKENWRFKLTSIAGKRGMTFKDGNIFVPSLEGVYVLDENNGRLNERFGKSGLISTGE